MLSFAEVLAVVLVKAVNVSDRSLRSLIWLGIAAEATLPKSIKTSRHVWHPLVVRCRASATPQLAAILSLPAASPTRTLHELTRQTPEVRSALANLQPSKLHALSYSPPRPAEWLGRPHHWVAEKTTGLGGLSLLKIFQPWGSSNILWGSHNSFKSRSSNRAGPIPSSW